MRAPSPLPSWRGGFLVSVCVAGVLGYALMRQMSVSSSLRRAQGRWVAERDQALVRADGLARELEQSRATRGRPAGDGAGGVNVLVLAGSSRDAQVDMPRLTLRVGQALQPVLAGFDVMRGGSSQRTVVLRIRSVERPKTVWEHRGAARDVWDAPNHLVSVLVPAAALRPGHYEFTIAEAAGSTPAYRAPFVVEAPIR